MKVLMIPSWYPSKSYPGTGTFFREQEEAMLRAGMDVTVLCIEIPYRRTKKDYSYFKKNIYVENGMKVYRYVYPLGILHRLPKLYYKFLEWIGCRIYNKEFKKENYDVVHAHSFLIGGYISNCLKRKFGCKSVITEHTSKILRNVLNNTEREILRKCVNESDHFICVSNHLKSYIENNFECEREIEVYPNLVNSKFECNIYEGEYFVFSSIGNLIPWKCMDLLIESFVQAFKADEKVVLNIMGEGPEREKLENIIKREKREHQIRLLGQVTIEQVSENLKNSNVMALVSSVETFGVVYVEGLLSGNVIIAGENGGSADIVKPENGKIVMSDKDKVAEVLREVYENYSRYDLKKNSDDCRKIYGEEAFVNAYKHFFEE